MFMIVRSAALIELGLQAFEQVFPAQAHMIGLPLGGDTLGQLGVVFTVAFMIGEAYTMWTEARESRERREVLKAHMRKQEQEERAAEEEKAAEDKKALDTQANDSESSDDAA